MARRPAVGPDHRLDRGRSRVRPSRRQRLPHNRPAATRSRSPGRSPNRLDGTGGPRRFETAQPQFVLSQGAEFACHEFADGLAPDLIAARTNATPDRAVLAFACAVCRDWRGPTSTAWLAFH